MYTSSVINPTLQHLRSMTYSWKKCRYVILMQHYPDHTQTHTKCHQWVRSDSECLTTFLL